jgi:hypothetical protein
LELLAKQSESAAVPAIEILIGIVSANNRSVYQVSAEWIPRFKVLSKLHHNQHNCSAMNPETAIQMGRRIHKPL